MKGEQAFGEVTHALMRKHYLYRPGHPGAHLCPAKSMVETPTMAAPRAHAEPLQSYPVIREAIFRVKGCRMDTLGLGLPDLGFRV